MNFSQKDIQQIESKGLTIDKVNSQIQYFKKGISYANLVSAATLNNGIIKLTHNQEKELVSYFEKSKEKKSVVKFIPASGAATRMFRFLFQFLADYNPYSESINAYINRTKAKDLSLFLVGIDKFPF